jgi:pimeloyl-ACP methyl ester carboxylesterase
MDLIDINGVKLEVQRIAPAAGTRALAPIIFLHEGLGSVAMWQGRTSAWPEQVCRATGRAGVVYSRRGYGQSDDTPDVRGAGRLAPDYMHVQAFEVLPELLLALGISKPVLLGHSDGGTIALLHASSLDVQACIVMAPHVMVEDVSITSIEQARTAFETGDLRQRLSRYHTHVDSAFWQWNDVWLSPAFRSFDIRSDCRRITAPVLAIQGLDDPYGTMAQIEQIAPTQGRVELARLAACGHSPHRDQPEESLRLVSEFLRAAA